MTANASLKLMQCPLRNGCPQISSGNKETLYSEIKLFRAFRHKHSHFQRKKFLGTTTSDRSPFL